MSDDTYWRQRRVFVAELSDFAQQFLGEFATMEMPLEDQLALYYHVRCEQFDRMICRHRDTFGDALPMTGSEVSAINRNASEVRRELCAAHPAGPLVARDQALRSAVHHRGDGAHVGQAERRGRGVQGGGERVGSGGDLTPSRGGERRIFERS